MTFLEYPKTLLLIALLSWPVYKQLGYLFFGLHLQGLGELYKYWRQKDRVSLWRGEFWQDFDASIKGRLFFLVCAAWVAAVTELIARYFY